MKTVKHATAGNSLRRAESQAQGFVLPMVVFLIVILAGAAVAISQLTVDNTQSNLQALQKTRADLFNQSLIDLAVHELATARSCNSANSEDSDEPYTHPDFPGLSAELKCESASYRDGELVLWTITSTANSAGGLTPGDEEYVWRRMSAVVELED